jgi:protein disulfide-isomerase-like protein
LKPVWGELASSSRNVKIGMVNCDVEVDLVGRFNIKGFPTLILFYNGEMITEYHQRARTLEDFKSFLANVNSPRKNREGTVDTLTDSNFDSETCIVESPVIVKFYSPNCGHCIQLAPTWIELAAALKGTEIRVAEIDCSANQNACNRYGVTGYPSIKLIRNGIQAEYSSGDRSLAALVDFAKSGWKNVAHSPRPGSEGSSAIDWKLIAIVISLFVVLFCGCILVLFWVTNDDYSSNDLKDDTHIPPIKRTEKLVVTKGTKTD